MAVCRGLGRAGYTVVCTARDPDKAEATARSLRDEGFDAVPHVLEVTYAVSAAALADFVDADFGRVDALVNNAAVSLDAERGGHGGLDVEIDTVRETLETNLYGPLRLCQAFLPMMRKANSGRIVNVSSRMGSLAGMGGGSPAYRISKAALNALTRVLSAEVRGTNILINSACPGWVRTDMGGPDAPRTPEQGADTIVWLATLPDDGPRGGFFQDRQPIPW
ncbi:MAG: SDR family oxidoreductase [Planctomycetia bacterium]|nr:SDR family oxidoreductase [Planctomycetia bacterium]